MLGNSYLHLRWIISGEDRNAILSGHDIKSPGSIICHLIRLLQPSEGIHDVNCHRLAV